MTPSGIGGASLRFAVALVAVVAVLNHGGLARARDGQAAKGAGPPERRLALLVGNAAYGTQPLADAELDDMQTLAQALRDVHFEVTTVENATRDIFDREVDQFAASLKPGDAVVFYYAGHGFQVEGENYMVPIDFAATDALDARYRSFALGRLQDHLAATPLRMSVTLLDACRAGATDATRFADGPGWAPVVAGANSAVMLGAAPGSTAGNVTRGGSRLFVAAWVESLRQPGLALEAVFARVQALVSERSRAQQVPWSRSAVVGTFVFRAAAAGALDASPPN